MSARLGALLLAPIIALGCGNDAADPVRKTNTYVALAKADEAFSAGRYSEALPLYDEAINASVVQADILAEIYLKRAACKLESGELDSAAEDLSQAELGGAVGEDYQRVQKMLIEKRRGS